MFFHFKQWPNKDLPWPAHMVFNCVYCLAVNSLESHFRVTTISLEAVHLKGPSMQK